MKRMFRLRWLCAAVPAAAAIAGCVVGVSSYPYAYYHPYYYYDYGYYYPYDLALSSWYWTDPYYWGTYPYYGPAKAKARAAGSLDPVGTQLGGVLAALANGEQVCPAQVTVTPQNAELPCPGERQAGARFVFDGCQLSNGARIDGTLDIAVAQTASDSSCNTGTTLTERRTITATDLSITDSSGAKLLIPSMTATANTAYRATEQPSRIYITASGQVRRVDEGSATPLTQTFEGTETLTLSSAGLGAYTTDGSITIRDSSGDGQLTATGAGLERRADCCYPVGGTFQVQQTGQDAQSRQLSFGPGCGTILEDGEPVDVAACD